MAMLVTGANTSGSQELLWKSAIFIFCASHKLKSKEHVNDSLYDIYLYIDYNDTIL